MVPAAFGLLVLAPLILQLIFENGDFDAQSTLLSARALRCYAPGLIVFSAAKVFVPAFYAMQDMKTPVRIGIYIVLLNLALNITFILTLPLYWKHAGMAASTVIAEAAGMIALGIILTRKMQHIQWASITRSFFRCLFCGAVMASAAWAAAIYLPPLFEPLMPPKMVQLCAVSLSVGIGATLYFILTFLLRAPELREILSAIRKR
jgi:putative peptidoglycan lipid II flippase